MKMSKYEEQLLSILKELLPNAEIITEYKFTTPERWRFDFAIIEMHLAFEAEGGIWMGGRHTNPKGFISDCKKYNRAVKLGWTIYRLPPELINKEYVANLIFNYS